MHDRDQGPEASIQPDNPARRRIFQAAAAVGAATLPGVTNAVAAPAKPVAKGSLDAKLRAHVKTWS